MRNERWTGIGIGVAVGVVVGVLVGMLTAPVTGREARRRLVEARGHFMAEAGEVLEYLAELADTMADWFSRVVGAEADRTRARVEALRADVERFAANRR